jgi:hypothetical protein
MFEQLQEGFQKWPKHIDQALERAALFKSLKEKVYVEKSELETFQTYEKNLQDLEPLLRKSTDVEKESYSQVIFQGNPWSSLNSIPFALFFLSIYKSYIVPGVSVLLPILTLLLPYLLLKMFYNIPIEFNQYMSILWRLWNGKSIVPEGLGVNGETEKLDPMILLKQIVSNVGGLFTIGQSIWQPIQQARHFQKLDKECTAFGNSILGIKEIGKTLLKRWKIYLPKWFGAWIDLCPSTNRQAFAFTQEYEYWLHHTKRAIERFQVLYTLARRPDVMPVEFVKSTKPILYLEEFGDPNIPYEQRILSSIKCKGHTIVTGPNRGGKSSFLRGILLNIKFAHCYGAVYAKRGQMSYFSWIADGLRLGDTPGKRSMFEREVEFATHVLEKKGGTGILIYDELFHSTNPPDAERTSRLFCEELWKKENCISLLSTHVYGLAEDSPDTIQKVCLASWKDKNNEYLFSYGIQKGICRVSSVDLVLQEHGWRTSSADDKEDKKSCVRQEE